MNYGYIRVSTDKQTVENQRFEINQFATDTVLLLSVGLKKLFLAQKIWTSES